MTRFLGHSARSLGPLTRFLGLHVTGVLDHHFEEVLRLHDTVPRSPCHGRVLGGPRSLVYYVPVPMTPRPWGYRVPVVLGPTTPSPVPSDSTSSPTSRGHVKVTLRLSPSQSRYVLFYRLLLINS